MPRKISLVKPPQAINEGVLQGGLSTPNQTSPTPETNVYLNLIYWLREQGMKVLPLGFCETYELFNHLGRALSVDGELIEVIHFKTPKLAKDQENAIKEITTQVEDNKDKDFAHFFRKECELVIYFGNNHNLLSDLERLLGTQIITEEYYALT